MTVNDTLRAAYAAYAKGDFGTARSHGEAALKMQPNHHVILQFLGVVLCQQGELERGADYLKQALARGGDSADNRVNLAKALVSLGRLDEAAALCEDAGDDPQLRAMRIEILKAKGSLDEAIWAYEDNVAAAPDDFDSWNNLGNARHAKGDLQGALSALHRARELNDKSAVVHTNIGRVLISLDRYEEACLYLEKAVMRSPGDHRPLVELARNLINIDHAAAGLRALGDAARINPRDPKIYVVMGQAFNDLSDPAKAENAYRIAIQVDAGYAPAYLDLGILLEKANRLDELEELLAQTQQRQVSAPEIDYLRALQLSRSGKLEEALALMSKVQTSAIHPAIQFQRIGQLADRLGRIDDAYYAYEDMNRAMAQSPLGFGMDREAYQRAIDAVRAKTTPEWYAGWRPVTIKETRPSPTFLVGFPRSGTTLLDTVLMGHSKTHVLEELPIIETLSNDGGDFDRIADMSEDEVNALRARYFSELDRLSPVPAGAHVIDKNPLSMIRMPLIHRLFPDAKIILALRHPADVVLSCFMQNFKPTEAMSSFLDLTNASRTYDRIFAYWEQCVEVLPLNHFTLRYEDMVVDMEQAVKPLFAFLDLEWEPHVLDHQKTARDRGYIRTPSYAQVTEKVYSSAAGRWARYRKYMNETLPILQPWIDRFGYSTAP